MFDVWLQGTTLIFKPNTSKHDFKETNNSDSWFKPSSIELS